MSEERGRMEGKNSRERGEKGCRVRRRRMEREEEG